ncbi:MAG: hypothetical protein NXI01_07580 [Gammaproteobacteria bacterium]|nr:hypothetical protein [Gammaproteobacteria bacterium]
MAEKSPVTLDGTIAGVNQIAGVAKTMADRGASVVGDYSEALGSLQKTMVSIQSGVPTGKMDAPAAATTPKMSEFSGGFLADKPKVINPSGGQASSAASPEEAKPEEPRSGGPGRGA